MNGALLPTAAAGNQGPLLRLDALSRHFGGLSVLQDVNLDIPRGGIFGLIGPNGAGKTTVFNLVTGLLQPTGGRIEFEGRSLAGRAPHHITRLGIARTFQNIRLFREMSLLENVMVGLHAQLGYRSHDLIAATPRFRRDERIARERARELLSWVRLERKLTDRADNLSYGDQRKLELARALASNPKLLLLDEPVAGMNSGEKDALMDEVRQISARGYTIFMIEHDMRFVMGLCQDIAVLNFGRIIARGTPDAIRSDPQVIEAYLGREDDAAGASGPVARARGDAPPRGIGTSAAGRPADAPLLQVRGLSVTYGKVEAVRGIDLALREGEITTLVGANGAGKSTTLLAISGLVKKAHGRVVFDGRDLTRTAPHRIVAGGVVQVAEGRATLTTLTVRENLELGAYARRDRGSRGADLARVFELFPVLAERADGLAGNLSGGEQQMLAIGRALMAKPRLLLLDEPSMGLAPIIVQEIFRTLREINRAGLTIFLVEQNVRQALKIAQHAYVIETGRIVLEGSGRALLDDPQVQAAYLGG